MKNLIYILLTIFLFVNISYAIPDYTKVIPRPSDTVQDWVREDSTNRQTITSIFQWTGGIIFVAGILVQNDPQLGTGFKIAGGIVYLVSFITNIKGKVEVKGEEIMTLPDKTAAQKFEKEALAADFILNQAEDEKIKKIRDTSMKVATEKTVDIGDVFNVVLETRAERAASKIRAQTEPNN